MLEQKTVKVCGTKITIQQLPTENGFEVFIALSKILAGAKDGVNIKSLLNFDEPEVNIGAIIAGIIEKTDVIGTPQFIRKLIEDSIIKPEFTEEFYNNTFAGNYSELFVLVGEIILFNHFDDVVKKNLYPFIENLLAPE